MTPQNCCPPSTPVQLPGSPGANAFTNTSANFVVPAANANVTVAVLSTASLVVGQALMIGSASSSYGGPANFQVVTVNSASSVTLKYLSYVGDVAAGQTISSGATVTQTGPNAISAATQTTLTGYVKGNGATVSAQAVPIPVADGGTGGITALAALASLGAAANGANGDITSLTGLTTPLPISEGGTSAATALAGLAALINPSKTGTFICNGASAVTVTNALVTANSVVIVCLKTVGGTVGAVPAVKTITPGAGFTIAGTASDTSTYNYIIIN